MGNEIFQKKKARISVGFLFAVPNGLEPSTSCVTGRHSNQTELRHQLCFERCKDTTFLLTHNIFFKNF